MLSREIWVQLVDFGLFVPLHNKVSLNQELTQNLANFVAYNWFRTALWSLIFLVGLIKVQK
jgi:hypothetical protein